MPKKLESGQGPSKEDMERVERRMKAVYACMVCNSMFKQPGYCPNCEVVLKKRAG